MFNTFAHKLIPTNVLALLLLCAFQHRLLPDVLGWTPTPLLFRGADTSFRTLGKMHAAAGNAVNVASSSLLVSNMDKIKLISDGDSDGSVSLVLASQSPRRREILDMMGLAGRYAASPSPLDEEALQIELMAMDSISPQDYARILAERKAHAYGEKMVEDGSGETTTTMIIGSDTIVDLGGSIMEKPKDEQEAVDMIHRLSGNWHQVHTGVAVYRVQNGENTLAFSFTDTTRVKFADLTDSDIRAYVATGEPMDKAGSYGIQGIGGQIVEQMEGDFFTVMGLPMHRLSKELARVIAELGAK